MTTPESRFSGVVREKLKGYGCEIERIENRVNLGIPDMLVGAAAGFCMLELKVVTRGLKVSLRPHQVAFMIRHSTANRPVFILVKDEPRKRICLYAGSQAVQLVEEGLRLPPLYEWPIRGMPWKDLSEALSR